MLAQRGTEPIARNSYSGVMPAHGVNLKVKAADSAKLKFTVVSSGIRFEFSAKAHTSEEITAARRMVADLRESGVMRRPRKVTVQMRDKESCFRPHGGYTDDAGNMVYEIKCSVLDLKIEAERVLRGRPETRPGTLLWSLKRAKRKTAEAEAVAVPAVPSDAGPVLQAG